MKKRIISIGSVLLCALLLAACGSKFDNEEPKSEISGFYSLEQRFEGGNTREKRKVNISGLSVSGGTDTSEIGIDFSRGSAAAGDKQKDGKIPHYEIYGEGAPYRLVVKLYNITFWDYKDFFAGVEEAGLTLDVYQPYTSGEDGVQEVYLFIQLNANSAYKVTEIDSKLVINIQKVNDQSAGDVFYVLSPSYYNWERMIGKVDLNPTLCSDLMRYQLISRPFLSESDADTFIDETENKLVELGINPVLIKKQLKKGALPEITEEDEKALFQSKNLVNVGGKQETLPLLMGYSKYLCSTIDGSRMLFAKDTNAGNMNSPTSSVELYSMPMGGKASKLDIEELGSVQEAAYSPDGTKLAILSYSSRTELLIYDLATTKLTNLGEEGIGNDVTSFAWDGDSSKIYAVAGDNGAYQLKTYDVASGTFDVLGENPLDKNGSFGFHGNQLYYSITTTQDAGRDGTIYKINTKTGQASKVTKGVSFEISPLGSYMAVRDITDTDTFFSGDEVGEGDPVEGLKIIDLDSGTETRLVEDEVVSSFAWGSGRLYYTVRSGNDSYPFALYEYVLGQSPKKIADLTSAEFDVSTTDNKLLLFDYVDQYYATYLLDPEEIGAE